MAEQSRAYRFVMSVDVERGHSAYDDPEWAADAAAGALTYEYGLPSCYSSIETIVADEVGRLDNAAADPAHRAYRFVVTFEVEPGHSAFDDPEWAADAAHGALTNEYGLRTTYSDIALIDVD